MKVSFPIFLEGAHSTGKSTLGPMLADALGVPFIKEIAREVLEEFGTTAAYTGKSDLEIAEIQSRLVEKKTVICRDYLGKGAVIDRSVVSVYAYSVLQLSKSNDQDVVNFLKIAKSIVSNFSNTEAVHLLFRPNIPLEKDGIREAGFFRREHVHLLVKGILTDFAYPFFELHTDTPQKRLKEVLSHVKRLQEFKEDNARMVN